MLDEEKIAELQQRLERLGVTGEKAGHERHLNLKAVRQLKEGSPKAAFGYHEKVALSEPEILKIMASYTGCSADFNFQKGAGYISPAATLKGLREMAQMIKKTGAKKGRLIVATGHTGGMTGYYLSLIPLLEKYGCQVLEGLGAGTVTESFPCPHCGQHMVDVVLDYVGKLAVLSDGEVILHTHASRPMEIILAECREQGLWPDLVIADHGFAGAAAKAGILTIAVMDTNDPGLALAKEEGAPLILLPLDDNRPNYLSCQVVKVLEELLEME